uniref:Uncharacterized protein n=1 Tax=Anguilla anguilla TaxID=7936 RepID=A0A0E9TIH3_ANGAN
MDMLMSVVFMFNAGILEDVCAAKS